MRCCCPKEPLIPLDFPEELCLSFEPPEKPGIGASTVSEGWPGINDGDIIPSSGRNICHSSALGEAFQKDSRILEFLGEAFQAHKTQPSRW